MKYCIVINDKIKEEYSTLEEAQLKQQKYLEKFNKKQEKIKSNVKFKKPDIKIIQIPEIGIGLKVYSAEDKFIGEIVKETNCLWLTKKTEDQKLLSPWMKSTFEDKYVRELFIIDDKDE